MVFSRNYRATSSLMDFGAKLSVMGMYQIAEDTITEFMGELKTDGITARREYNAVWVFAKNKVKILKDIPWNSGYGVTCFISEISHIYLIIDVAIKNSQGELCVYSRTKLCAIDCTSGKLRKVSTVGIVDITSETPLLDINFGKITAEDLPVVDTVEIKYTNIDLVHHTNNKEYIRFILNTYTVSEMEDSPIGEMEVVFINQSYEKDKLTIRKCCYGNKDVILIEKEGEPIVKSEITHRHK